MYKAVFAAFCAFYVGRGSFQPLFFVMKSLRIFCQYSFWLRQCLAFQRKELFWKGFMKKSLGQFVCKKSWRRAVNY